MAQTHAVHDDLRRNVVWSPTDSVLAIALELDFTGKSEVGQFQLHLAVDEQVTQLNAKIAQKVTLCE